jgi:hypothetical protein
MDEFWGYYAKWNKTSQKEILYNSIYEVSKAVKLVEIERIWLPGAKNREKESWCSRDTELVLQDKKLLGSCCPTMWTHCAYTY